MAKCLVERFIECQKRLGRIPGGSAMALFFVSLLVSKKYLDDDHYSNEYYAKVGGIDLVSLNKFEVLLLKVLEWNLTI